MSKEWNATVYHQISAPQISWGKKVLARICLRGDENVLDAGCGTGRLTRDLLEALPRGRVVALDVSQNMLDAARAYLTPDFGDRVEFLACDLLQMPFEEKFDGIFSTASFHWVRDHEALFQRLYRALRPGGWLCAQCGGAGNLDRFFGPVEALMATPAYAPFFHDIQSLWEFSDATTAAKRLRNAGFETIETDLEDAPTKFSSPEEFRQFVGNVILHRHLERLPSPELRQQLLAAVTAECAQSDPPLLLDYVRLNLQARKPRA
jgi:trans-aconitate 2-methyltransferase